MYIYKNLCTLYNLTFFLPSFNDLLNFIIVFQIWVSVEEVGHECYNKLLLAFDHVAGRDEVLAVYLVSLVQHAISPFCQIFDLQQGKHNKPLFKY